MIAWSAGMALGPYELTSPIGKGGMGEVWKARDTRLNRVVAIKRLAEKHSSRFEQEARAIAALNHPHICTLHDIGPDYLVMEYVEGSPLKGPLTAKGALRLALQIAGALGAAHAKGIIHRDLKPANILVGAGGTKLLDFGLAKVTEAEGDATQTIEGTLAGTAAYMSPEQARGEALDARSDIFSFGAVLYELLGGRRAFTGTSTTDILSAVLRDEPSVLDAPADLIRIIRKCLRKPRDERYASMAELRAALEQVRLEIPEHQSIAVLPFANMSRDRDDAYFSDGLAEEIINLLNRVPNLKVTARTSAFAFRGKEQDITKIAEALRVKTILEGSVRRAGDRIRVTAELVNADDGYHVWSERYDRTLDDVFAIQDEIAAAIAQALQLKLSPSASVRHQPKLPAYEAYLKYRHYQWLFTPGALRLSREYLEQAIALDSQFALPHVGLADHHNVLAFTGQVPAREAMPRARALAQRALELEPGLPDAHAMLGIVAGELDHDWQEAERQFQLALAREPVPPFVHHWHAVFCLLPTGRAEEAVAETELFLKEDPLSQIGLANLGNSLQALGRDAEAKAAWRRSVEIDPNFYLGWLVLGLLHSVQGAHTEALLCAQTALSLAPAMPWVPGLAAAAFEASGQADRARELLAKLLPGDAYGAPSGLCVYSLARGDFDSAVKWASLAVEQRHFAFMNLIVRPFERWLRQSAGWPELLNKMNVPETAR